MPHIFLLKWMLTLHILVYMPTLEYLHMWANLGKLEDNFKWGRIKYRWYKGGKYNNNSLSVKCGEGWLGKVYERNYCRLTKYTYLHT